MGSSNRTLWDSALIKQKNACNEAVFITGVLSKAIMCARFTLRIFRLRSRPRTLFQSASSILRRRFPVLRFRTYGLLRNLVVSPILTTIQSNKKRAPKRVLFFITGAADKNRTYDPVITNDVLYH